jgi:hypothetical protein
MKTRPNGLTIEQDRTGSALSDATAKFRTLDVKFVSQRPKQGHLRFDIQRMTLSIHRQLHFQMLQKRKNNWGQININLRRLDPELKTF